MEERIFISRNLYDGKTGGGNNFLKMLNNYLQKSGHNSTRAHFATTILINSHHNVLRNLITKFVYPHKKFIIRIDGKSALHRTSHHWDRLVEWQAKYLADSIIYQSKWSKNLWEDRLETIRKPSVVILNSCDREIFHSRKSFNRNMSELRIISSANSDNENKGLKEIYKLDALLSANLKARYTINVFGFGQKIKQPKLNNIILSPRVDQKVLADEIRKCDLFYAPFVNDSCSNSIIEALACGVPVLAMHSGANVELVKDYGLLYYSFEDLKESVLEITANLDKFSTNTKNGSWYYNRDVSREYLEFAEKTKSKKSKFTLLKSCFFLSGILMRRFFERVF